MQNNPLIKLFNRQKYSAGYTLTELIIGAGISVVVIGAAGMGLMNLMRGNNTSTTQADRRAEVNRALEFISDEVRRAETIQTNVSNSSDGVPYSDLPSGFGSNGEEIVLALNLPALGQDNPNKKVIYYVKPKPDSNWLGPNVIYRFGPPLDTTGGSYTTGAWVDQALIDRVDDQTITLPSSSCGTGKTPLAAKGFAACVDNKEKVAKIYVNGKFSDSSSDKYNADMQVYARAEAEHLTSSQPNVNFNPVPGGGGGSPSVKNIASEMGCNPNGDKCSISTAITQSGTTTTIADNDPETDVSIDSSQVFTVEVTPSTSGVSNPFTSAEQNNTQPISIEVDLSQLTPTITAINGTQSEQVQLLWDGSDVPNNPAWNPQSNSSKFKKIAEVLDGQNPDGTDFIQNGKITLPNNQYLLVFEVGQTYDGSPTTDINGDGNVDIKDQKPGFDLQDKVLLITIK